MIQKTKNLINSILYKFGYRFSKINNTNELTKLYKYKNYSEYKNTQEYYNLKKIKHIWADSFNLKKIASFLNKNIKSKRLNGICHGTRNGFEQNHLMKLLKNSKIIGTDISKSATKFENSFVWDFHKVNKKWKNKFDFLYSNSLDQSYNPKKALETWIDQIKINGYMIIEHSEQHGVIAASKMDPFGVEANFFPYLISEWFGHKISISVLKSHKPNKQNAPVWLFFIRKLK